jgi:hypothetical protein
MAESPEDCGGKYEHNNGNESHGSDYFFYFTESTVKF